MKTETNRSMGYYGTGTHLFNDGWEFAKQPLFTSCEEVKQTSGSVCSGWASS